MSLYTPFQLVHAHLSPSPVAEVVVPTERPFPPTREAYTAPLHEEHALSASFDPRTATLARSVCNGYVLELRSLSPVAARTTGDSTPALRIHLPDPLRPLASGCIVPSLRSGRLVVVVLTEADVVYRFSFPLGAFADKGDRINFANTTKHGDWYEEWELDPDVVASTGGVGSWQVTNEDTVVLGCADGGILKVSRTQNSTSDNPQWTESHHRASSRLRIGSLFSRATDELVTSIAEFDYEDQISVVYTFSRDGKLRTWSAATGQCLKSIDVRVSSNQVALASSTQSNPNYTTGELSNSLIRVIAHPNPSSRFSHIVVVFVPTPYNPASPGTFVFYRASNTAYGANDLVPAGERPGSPASAASELRGFEIQPPTRTDAADGWRLWAVWDSKGMLAADSVPVNDILQFTTYHEPYPRPRMVLDWQRATVDDAVERFDAAYFDNLLGTDAPDPANPYDNSDISDVFVNHLFQPARFSQDTLTTALENYLERLPQAQADKLQSTVFPSLSRRFVATVGCMLRMETSPQTGAPVVDAFRKALKLEWLGIWARARELDKQARWPVGTSSINGQLLVLDREGASAPVIEDAPGVLVRLGLSPADAADFQTLPEGALAAVYPSLAPPLARRALTALAIGGERLAAALREQEAQDAPTALDAFVAHANDELAAPPRMPVENLAASWWDDLVEPYLVSEDLAALQAAVGECSTFGVTRALSAALDLLATAPAPSNSKTADTWSFGGFGNALLASTVSAIITARYAFARDLLLVSLYHLSVTPDPEDDDDLLQVLARAQVAYHRYRVLAWLAAQTGEEAGERARARRHAKRARGKDDMLAEFDSLRMREGGDDSHEPADTDGYDTSYSLLHSLLARALPQPVPRDTVAALFDSASQLLSDLSLLDAGLVDTEPCTPDVRLAHAVLRDGHAAVADDLTELYPLSAGMAFVRGRALLEMGKVGAAVAMLERAAAGVRDGSLADILPTCTGKSGLGEYYRRIMAVVDEHGLEHPVAHFGKLALEASEHGDPSTSDIWTRVFLAHLAMGEYEDAYTTLTSAPFQEIKRDLLGQLISAMCEANEVGRLNSLGFIGFQKDVEERLNFKARNSDPLRAPNYYTVLYSWHISRGDYRSAAEIMYAQGQRFADAPATRVPAQQLASMRAQSYLAAINALALVEPRNAWISVHADPESRQQANGTSDDSGRDAKRRRVTHYIPESEFSQGNKPVDIVTLPDMRREYTAVLAQLRLASSIPDLHDARLAGVSLTPAELVGFFTQRSLFDYAQSSAAALDVDMTDLFVALASRCLELARAPPNTPSADFLALSPVTARLRGPPGMLALRYLQVALARHDSEKTQWRYHAAVAETFLSLSPPGTQPPAWLVAAEMARDPQGWIARALKHGWVPEATGWSADVVRKLPAAEMLRKPDAVEGPYNLIDRVVAAADGEDKETQAKAQALRDMVGRRAKAMKAITA